jgi:hypothetical protein
LYGQIQRAQQTKRGKLTLVNPSNGPAKPHVLESRGSDEILFVKGETVVSPSIFLVEDNAVNQLVIKYV